MRDDVDGDEAMVPRVPNLPPEPSARQIAEHELMGHAVYRSWCRHCVASKGRAHAHSSRFPFLHLVFYIVFTIFQYLYIFTFFTFFL